MSQMPKIQPKYTIEFGKTLLASEKECFSGYAVNVFGDARIMDKEAAFGDRHILYSLLLELSAAFESITNPILVTEDDEITFVGILRNITRLARLKLDGDAKIQLLNNINKELRMNGSTELATNPNNWDTGLLAQIAVLVAGAGLDGLVGNWDNQKYVIQDEIIGGIFLCTFYLLTWYGLHISTWNMLIHSIGDFSTAPGLRGNFRPLIPSDEKTWGALLCSQENSTNTSIFGIKSEMLDDPQLRAISVVKLEGIEKMISKLLTSSQWTWRFGRWMRIQPVYFCADVPGLTLRGPFDSVCYDEFGDEMVLFSNHTGGNQWRTFNNDLLEFVSDLKSFYFKNKSYSNLKAMMTVIPFENFPQPGPFGVGGIAFHSQNTCVAPLSGRTLVMNKYLKEYLDKLTASEPMNKCMSVFRNYREYNNDNRFMIIGDMDIEDVLLMLSFTPSFVDDMAGDIAETAPNGFVAVTPIAYFGFGIGKTEEQPYKIGRVVYDCMGKTGRAPTLRENTVVTMIGHITHGGALREWNAYIDTDDVHFPVSAERPYPLFKFGRGLDPYKKLKHDAIDANQLDYEYIQKVALKYLFPISTTATIQETPIAVSAIVEPPSNQTLVSDDVNSKKELTATPLPVSAACTPKKEEKKDEKNAK